MIVKRRYLTLSEWILRQGERDDPIGDLARDAAVDSDWPERGDYSDLVSHLPKDLDPILDDAYDEYHDDLDRGKCLVDDD